MTKVEAHGQPTEADARVGPKKIRDLYDKGVKATNPECQRYWENTAFLQGEQWVYWSKTRNRLEEVPRDPARVRATINRLAATKRRLLAKTLKKPLVFEVPPAAADDATVQAARVAESIISDRKREQNWETLREEATIAAFDGGTGLICLDWDPAGGEPLDPDPDDPDLPVGTGDGKLTVLAITEWVTEPGTRDVEFARWGIKAQALPAKEVQATWNLPDKPAADASQALSPVQQKILSTDRAYRPEDLSLVLTYYERPSDKNKAGQVCVVVGDQMVDGPHPWPFPFTDRMNVVCVRETKVLHRWTGDTILSQAVPVQTLYNQIWSSIGEHTKLAGNARILWPEYAGDAVDSLSDLPSEIVNYMPQPNGAKPEWWFPTQLPDWLIRQPEMLEKVMDDILCTPDVTRGEAPRNIESGSGLAILSEQAETPVARLATEVADGFARVASLLLECYEENIEETRQARVDYPHQVSQTVPWTGKDLMGQTRVIVPENAVLPVSEAEVWTKAVNLWDRGFFRKADQSMDYQQFARFVSSSGEDNFVEATDPDVSKANRENYTIANGEPMLPAAFDDHAKHIEVHNAYRKSASFERLPQEVQMMFEQHCLAHQNMAAEDAAQLQNKQMQDMGGGHFAAAPTANQAGGMNAVPPGADTSMGAQMAPNGGTPDQAPDMLSGATPDLAGVS